jgi:hypothetical protein
MLQKRNLNLTITVKHISTMNMLASLLTKSLPPNIFPKRVADMGLREAL